MAPIASSFIADITTSLLDKLTTDVGVGSSVYPTPAYLQIRTLDRAGGNPQMLPPDQETPALWIEYIAGGDSEAFIGRPHGVMVEAFNLYSYAVFSPDSIGMDTRDGAEFRLYAEASADVLMRRIWKSIIGWTAAITDPIIGGTTNGARVLTWSFVLTARDTLLIEARSMMSFEVDVE